MRIGQMIVHERTAPAPSVIRRFPGVSPLSITIAWKDGVTKPQKDAVARRLKLLRMGPEGPVELYTGRITTDFIDFQVMLENEPTIEETEISPGQMVIAPKLFGLKRHLGPEEYRGKSLF